MDKENNKQSISEIVTAKIKEGQIKMRPKIYFGAKLVLLFVGMITLTLCALFLVSFILFSLRQSGLLFLPNLGFPGIRILFFSLPWILILGAVALIITSEFFAKHFAFIYRQPILYSFLAIIIFVFIGGIALNFTPLHSGLLISANRGGLPLAGGFYREFGSPKMLNVFYGSIFEITNNGFKIDTPRSEELNIIIGPKTIIRGKTPIEGDSVIILGKKLGQIIEASDIKKVDERQGFFPGPKFPDRRHMQGPVTPGE